MPEQEQQQSRRTGFAHDLKSLLEISYRTDERVKRLSEQQTDLAERVDSTAEDIAKLTSRVIGIEARSYEKLEGKIDLLQSGHNQQGERLTLLERDNNLSMNRWQQLVSMIFQIVATLAAGALLYRFGLR